jgi:hypothetical protein
MAPSGNMKPMRLPAGQSNPEADPAGNLNTELENLFEWTEQTMEEDPTIMTYPPSICICIW